ncbi:sporulation killing factor system integral membrane protein [Bacillus xiamenensis]|uniref:Sporulation killing factor system integral membrane protein n=1 Tax=Bacillus xiamenensis TaxID=1178537 RepID=A0AAC9IJB4_9BACI|nr:sporulation killing factor system integral membrane protein [Bacillus xiamenensis]AOZ88489.1 sporulation killing factor system integral membrane protein [Bacillus xiamenensis]MCW1837242.1 sporulation killing factor system integral membrane protein [Bacillus xiamenensis]
MNNTLSLLWMKSQRRLISKHQEKKMPFLILLLMIAAIGFQLSAVSSIGDWNASTAGWIIVVLFVLYTGFGLFSNRLPSQMNDIMWLYGNGASLWTVVMSVWVYHILWRCAFLIVSAVMADILLLCLTQQYFFLLGKSLLLTGLLCMVETWMIAVSCARTIQVYKRVLFIGFILMFGCLALLILNQLILKQSYLMEISASFMFQVGRRIEEFSFLSVWLLLGVMILSFMMMYRSTHRIEMMESLVKEAAFWEEFEGKEVHSHPISPKKSKTWWGLPSLTGIWAFLWLELLMIKKYITFHLLSTMLLIGTYYVVMSYFSDWLNLFFLVIGASVLLSSYYAGIVRHAQTGVLYLFPGVLYQKILLLEVFQTFWLYGVYLISLVLLEIQDVLYWTVYGGGGYIWFLAIRLFAFMQPLRRETSLSLGIYYRSLLIGFVISAVVIVGIHLFTDGWFTAMTCLFAGFVCYVICYRCRGTH